MSEYKFDQNNQLHKVAGHSTDTDMSVRGSHPIESSELAGQGQQYNNPHTDDTTETGRYAADRDHPEGQTTDMSLRQTMPPGNEVRL
jgi:hypothetical protein